MRHALYILTIVLFASCATTHPAPAAQPLAVPLLKVESTQEKIMALAIVVPFFEKYCSVALQDKKVYPDQNKLVRVLDICVSHFSRALDFAKRAQVENKDERFKEVFETIVVKLQKVIHVYTEARACFVGAKNETQAVDCVGRLITAIKATIGK